MCFFNTITCTFKQILKKFSIFLNLLLCNSLIVEYNFLRHVWKVAVRWFSVDIEVYGTNAISKRIRRLMRQMGLEAVYPRRKRGLCIPDKQHTIYPYLFKDVQIEQTDKLWFADITYIRRPIFWVL